ncbi:hypothetical protein Taro_035257, partial [Colocasia esculenta]|nr:hypothetical protein [Colocasia esculenta]
VLFPHRTHCHRCRLPASGTGAGQHRVGLRSQPRQSKFHRLNQKQPTSRDGPARPSSSHRQHLLHSIVPRRVNLPRRSARGLRSSIPPAYQQRRATSNWVVAVLANLAIFFTHACARATYPSRSVTTTLQCRHFYADFVPRDPKSKPKRYKYPEVYDPYGPQPPPSDKIAQLADRIAALPPEELRQIGPSLRERLKHPKLQPISTDGLDLGPQSGGPAAKVEEKKAEKTAFDVKLEKFDAAAKIKVIKEVRAFTNLGLKEAKDLVEKTPVLLKQGVTKEAANDIIEKIKAAGGVAIM